MKKFLFLTVLLAAAALSANAADVKANWEQHCTKCHGADGKGQAPMGKKLNAKDYTDAKVQAALKDEDLTKAIKDGVKDKATDKTIMKGYPDLSADETKALVAYIRAFKK